MLLERWEHGSDFHCIESHGSPQWPWYRHRYTLAASGREALRQLYALRRDVTGARRVWLPDYYCQDVASALTLDGAEVRLYRDDPRSRWPELTGLQADDEDMVVVVNTWGLRAGSPPRLSIGGVLVEDHTHDLLSEWAFDSRAHYAFASLRKSLPLPDGGVVWSPAGSPLPPMLPPSPLHEELVEVRARAMAMKATYLAGGSVAKREFLVKYSWSEERVGAAGRSGIAASTAERLDSMPAEVWRRARGRNFDAFVSEFGAITGCEVLRPPPGATAFAVTLVCDGPFRRNRIRSALIARGVYPAVLWPLEDPRFAPSPQALALSRRVMSLHCDFRYEESDMLRVAMLLRELLER